jgi:hypothetical protein
MVANIIGPGQEIEVWNLIRESGLGNFHSMCLARQAVDKYLTFSLLKH